MCLWEACGREEGRQEMTTRRWLLQLVIVMGKVQGEEDGSYGVTVFSEAY